MRDDITACFGSCALTAEGSISEKVLRKVAEATEAQFNALYTFWSSVERGSARFIGPRNLPHHECNRCDMKFDTLQRLAVHMFAAHRQRNPWRALIQEPECPFCQRHFATVEIAKRHVTRNVCGRRVAPPPEADTGMSTAVSQGSLSEWMARR